MYGHKCFQLALYDVNSGFLCGTFYNVDTMKHSKQVCILGDLLIESIFLNSFFFLLKAVVISEEHKKGNLHLLAEQL